MIIVNSEFRNLVTKWTLPSLEQNPIYATDHWRGKPLRWFRLNIKIYFIFWYCTFFLITYHFEIIENYNIV